MDAIRWSKDNQYFLASLVSVLGNSNTAPKSLEFFDSLTSVTNSTLHASMLTVESNTGPSVVFDGLIAARWPLL